MLEDAAGPFGAAVGEERRGRAQGGATEITVDPVALDAVEKRGHLDELRAHGDEAVVDDRDGRWSGPGGGCFFLTGGGHGEDPQYT